MGQKSLLNLQPPEIKPTLPKSVDLIEIGAQFDNVILLYDRGRQEQHHTEKVDSLADLNTIIIKIAYHASSKRTGEGKRETWNGYCTLDKSRTRRSSGEAWNTVGYFGRLEERKLSSRT